MTALDIRNNRMTKAEADELIKKYEGKKPHSLNIFLEYIGLSENEFNNIIKKTVVPPNVPNFNAEYSEMTSDCVQCYRSCSGIKQKKRSNKVPKEEVL